MTDRLAGAAALAVLALGLGLGLGGCGGSSSSTTATTSTTTSAPVNTTSISATTTVATTRSVHRTSATKTHSTTTPQAPTTRHAPTTPQAPTTAPPAAPAGTPAAPDGLRSATGYQTYELCASPCAGAVPASLRRPLHLPQLAPGSSCPASAGSGPVKQQGSPQLALTQFIGSPWLSARVTWEASASYTGPVLIRGRLLGGSGAVGFGEGHVPYDELQLLASGQQAPRAPGGGRSWLSITRVRASGCYAYQVDGTTFSSVVVFRAS